MVTARSGQQFEATLEGVPTGLEGTVALTVDDEEGTAVIARSAATIVELSDGSDPGLGVYVATRTAPTVDIATAYTLVWDLGDPEDEDETYSDVLVVYEATTISTLPTVDEIATIAPARTYDSNGNQLGEFSSATRPTDVRVARLIDQAAADVAMRVGVAVPDALAASVRHVIAIRTAMLIEGGYLPEQAGDGNESTLYLNFRFQYAEQIEKLVRACQLRQVFSEGTDQTLASSPYTYRNVSGYREDVIVSGGTVSAISTSSDGSAFSSTGETYGVFFVADGDYLRVTYTVAPTITTRRPVFA